MTESNEDTAPNGASRRAVLLGASAAGAFGVLAACGTNTPAAAPTTAPTTASATTPPAAVSSPPVATSSGGAAADPNAISAADIPVGGGKVFPERNLVVTQPASGTFKAFDATCTHQGCKVFNVSEGKINCPCHMSQFSATDGSVVRGPATRALAAMNAIETNGSITVT